MAKLTLSPQFIDGLKTLSSLNQSQLTGIVEYIKTMPVGMSINNIEKYLSSQLAIEEVDNVFPTIISITRFVQKNKDKDAIGDILESIDSEESIDSKKVQIILSEILENSKSISLTNKAADLLRENNNNFEDCRIVTDVRLVFDDNITDSKRNGLVIHKLHFEVSNPSNSKDVFIHLDINDLQKLKELVERAILKEDLIKEDYENINFISFE